MRIVTPVTVPAAALLVLACARTVSAQSTPEGRVAVFIGASYQPSANTFSNTVTFEAFAEN